MSCKRYWRECCHDSTACLKKKFTRMKYINPQLALQVLYFLLFFMSFGLWHYFQDYSDYLLISLQWYPAACFQLSASNKGICSSGITSTWHIHNFQAYKKNGVRSYCDNRYPFIANTVKADHVLSQNLENSWPSLINGTRNEAVWKHNYVKYGTCVEKNKNLTTFVNYFRRVFTIFESISLEELLKDNKLEPSNIPYKLSAIKKAIEEKTKASIQFQCVKNKSDNQQILSQVHFCLSVKDDGKFVDCQRQLRKNAETLKWDLPVVDISRDQFPCDHNQDIIYLQNNE